MRMHTRRGMGTRSRASSITPAAAAVYSSSTAAIIATSIISASLSSSSSAARGRRRKLRKSTSICSGRNPRIMLPFIYKIYRFNAAARRYPHYHPYCYWGKEWVPNPSQCLLRWRKNGNGLSGRGSAQVGKDPIYSIRPLKFTILTPPILNEQKL